MKLKTQFVLLTGIFAQTAGTFAQSSSSEGAGFTNQIRMFELGYGNEDTVLWDMPAVAAEGEDVLVGEPVPEPGALFVLSTIQHSPFQNWYLGEAAVGAYLPEATLKIVTHDTESVIPRTRADQFIQLQAEVSGLYNGVGSQVVETLTGESYIAATQVRLQYFAQDYPEGQSSLPGGVVDSYAYTESALVGNGSFPRDEGDLRFITNLNRQAPDQARGEERYVIRSLNDGASQGVVLSEGSVQVWPVWSGSKTGIETAEFLPYSHSGSIPEPVVNGDEISADEGFVFADEEEELVLKEGEVGYDIKPPEVTFAWKDLYPTSTVGLIVNDADQPSPWGGRWVRGSVHHANEPTSFDWVHVEKEWDGVFTGQGRYAVWMVTHTPGIGWEVGGRQTSSGFQEGGWILPIKRQQITVRASVQSLK